MKSLPRIGSSVGYTNEITTANSYISIGKNENINTSTILADSSSDTGAKDVVVPLAPEKPVITTSTTTQSTFTTNTVSLLQHDNEKTAIIFGGIALAVAAIWFLE